MSTFKGIAVCAALLVSLGVQAQVKFTGGLNAGLITSQVHGDNFAGFNKFGFHVGGQVGVALNDQNALLVEMMYTQKGSRNNPDLSDPNANTNVYKLKLDYIELPVSFQHRFNPKVTAHAGLYWARLISGYEEFSSSGRDDLGDAFTKADIGFQLGAAYDFSERNYLRLRYSGSMIPMRGEGSSFNVPGYWQSGGYNIVLYLGYGIRL